MARRRLVIGAAVIAVVAAFATKLAGPLTTPAPQLLASNLIDNFGGLVVLEPGHRLCQDGEWLPEASKQVTFDGGADRPPAGPVEVTYHRTPEGPPVVRGRSEDPIEAVATIGVDLPPHPGIAEATLCVRNVGPRAEPHGARGRGRAAGQLPDERRHAAEPSVRARQRRARPGRRPDAGDPSVAGGGAHAAPDGR